MGGSTLYHYRFKPTRVVDGDTVDGEIDLGFDIHVRERIRLARIDAPEKNATEEYERTAARKAASRLHGMLMRHDEAGPPPPNNRWVGRPCLLISTDFRGKYGRIIGEINLEDGTNVNDAMMAEGHAVEYPKKWREVHGTDTTE